MARRRFLPPSLLQLEVEAGFGEPPVFPLVEPVQPRRPVRHVLLDIVGFNQQIHREDALAEVAFVELALEHQFVEVLERATA